MVSLALLCALAAPAHAAFVAIDPGHGDRDSGAVGPLAAGVVATGLPDRADDQGRPVILEKDVTLDVARRLDAWLRLRGHTTVMTRTGDLAGGDRPFTNVLADLRARVDVANREGAELFVSIHQNSLGPTATGTETYHFTLASPRSRALALAVQQEVVLRLGLPDRGVKTAGFYVLKHTLMPAVLVEGAFLSNPAEAALMADPVNRQRMAEAVGAGVERYLDGSATPPGPDPESRRAAAPIVGRYWVTAGVFADRAAAERRRAELRSRGVVAVTRMRHSARLGQRVAHVVTGYYALLGEARAEREVLIGLGYPGRVNSAPPPGAVLTGPG